MKRPKHKAHRRRLSLAQEAQQEARRTADADPSVNFHEELRLCRLERGLTA